MKRVLCLLLGAPAIAGLVFLSGCGDGVEPRPATPTVPATQTPIPPTNTPALTVTPKPTDTPSGPTVPPTPTATGSPPVAVCGNGVMEGSEECDDGNNYGADGCAANCTLEQKITLDLGIPNCVGGEFDGVACDASQPNFGCSTGTCGSTSLTVVHSTLINIYLLISGMQSFEIGGITGAGGTTGADGFTDFNEGEIPVAANVTDSKLDTIPIPGIGCACVRGRPVKSCGGRPLLPGNGIVDCTATCEGGDEDGLFCDPEGGAGSTCPGGTCMARDSLCDGTDQGACAFTHGSGRSASGVFGCNGLTDIDYAVTLDSTDTNEATRSTFTRSGGQAPAGSAFILNSTAIGTITGNCSNGSGNPGLGPDGIACTPDDPAQGQTTTIPQTTGSVAATLTHANNMPNGQTLSCTDQGSPVSSCEALLAGNASGAALANAFNSEDVAIVGDIAVCGKFVAQ